ncbi:RNA-binding protein 48 isoform X2 [Juglans microcarpa x Juglans regia]|uniref:RNA-binding protein 48 isoform X2 n=1 Tax=Juglans microcarpa x Juglans regia TaxID=2249226 RepID=UPI001B7F1A46|nr:RNA-binding protein 48 isoform X2 [Juglans microcarpa x Juglans regia]
MPRYKDEPPAVRVYTVCDESRYLIVRNIPALGCGDELLKLFASYGEVEECKPMDEEECEQFTDVYWIKFRLVSNARFAKRKLDEFVFLGNRLQVSYAPQYESLSDTKDKLEGRTREVLTRLNPGRSKGPKVLDPSGASTENSLIVFLDSVNSVNNSSPLTLVSSDQDYFASQSMNHTVQLVREKLNKIQSSSEHLQPAPKKTRVDNRRRI